LVGEFDFISAVVASLAGS